MHTTIFNGIYMSYTTDVYFKSLLSIVSSNLTSSESNSYLPKDFLFPHLSDLCVISCISIFTSRLSFWYTDLNIILIKTTYLLHTNIFRLLRLN